MKRIVLGCASMCFALLFGINYFLDYSLRLFLHDILNLFRDNRSYLIHYFIPIILLSCCIGIISYWALTKKMSFSWSVRLGKKIWKVDIYVLLKRCGRKICIFLIAMCACMLVFSVGKGMSERAKKDWKGDLTIAHAGGAYDGIDYLNCLEALEYNYERGQRTFEIDFEATSDNKLICSHAWKYTMLEENESGEAYDEETFLSIPLLGKYTTISFADLCRIMERHPDMWVVTDFKDAEDELIRRDFEIMVSTAQELNLESVLDRIVVQIYNEDMYDIVKDIYPFQSWIYTLYKNVYFGGNSNTFREYVRFCYSNGIKNITMWKNLARPELIKIADEYGIMVYVHTEDDIENAKKLMELGVSGIYTNILTSDKFEEE